MTLTEFKFTSQNFDWLKRYIENAAPSGNEINGQKIWIDYIKPYVDDIITDDYGNVAAVINPEADFKVVVEAHADEIAWYVHMITPDGFIHVEKNGGSDPGIAPSQKVRIHTEQGVVPAIFGWPAIHTRNTAHESAPNPDSIFVDCGCRNQKEVEKLGIQVGDCITYDSSLTMLNKKFLVGRAQDNKVGGFMIANVARLIRENNIQLPLGLYIVNSVQEEVGLRGAGMMAKKIQPNCAIVTDVTHATHTPMVSKNKLGDYELDYGPVVTKSPSVHNKLREHIINCAKENDIPYQLKVSSKKTGTDADAFAYTDAGIPSALISLPMRYMHTTVETTSIHDIENTIKLLFESITSLKPDFNFSYFS